MPRTAPAISLGLPFLLASLAAQEPPACHEGCTRNPLACDATLEGALVGGDCLVAERDADIFELDLAADGEMEIVVAADGFEPVLILESVPAGAPCVETVRGSDACAPGETATTCLRGGLAAGRHYVVVTSQGDAGAGSYVLRSRCIKPPCDPACSAAPIACGERRTGELPAAGGEGCRTLAGTAFHVLPFALAEPTTLDVTWTAAFPAAVSLELGDAAGSCTLVAELGDCTEPPCPPLHLAAGDYRLVIASQDPALGGAYELTLDCEPFSPCASCPAAPIACGVPHAGELPAAGGESCRVPGGSAADVLSFSLAEPTTLDVTWTANFPATVSVQAAAADGSCTLLAEPGDCADAPCPPLHLAAGDYRLVITSPDPALGGVYFVTLGCRPFAPCAACPAVPIGCGETRTSQLDAGDCQFISHGDGRTLVRRSEKWQLEVEKAGPVVLRVEAGEVELAVALRDAKCAPLAAEPGPCPDGGKCVVYTLEPGPYVVEVSRDDDAAGLADLPYTIAAECVDLGPCRDCLQAGALACGQTARGVFSDGDCSGPDGERLEVWRFPFTGPVSDLRLVARAATFLPQLVLLDECCSELQAGAACGEDGLSSCLDVTTPTRSFHVAVTAPAGALGEYELAVECAPFSSCALRCKAGDIAPGAIVQGELGTGDCSADGVILGEHWALDLEAETLLDVLVEGEGFVPTIQVAGESCAPLAAGGWNDGSLARFTFAAEPGEHRIVITNTAAEPGQGGFYTLRVKARDCDACAPSAAFEVKPEGVYAGRLEAGDCADLDGFRYDVWTLELDRPKEVRIGFEPGDFLASVWALEEGCRLRFAFTQDQGATAGGLFEAGRHSFIVTNFVPGARGAYGVRVACRDLAACLEECAAGTLACGETAAGAIAPGDCEQLGERLDSWRLDVPAPGEITVSLAPGTAAAPLRWALVSGTCASELRPEELCEPPAAGPIFCALEPGAYRVVVAAPVPLAATELPYELTVHTNACMARSGRQLPGDCNGDARVNITDAICMLAYLFQALEKRVACGEGRDLGPGGLAVLDVSGDGKLNISDPIRLLLHLFQGGAPHALGRDCVRLEGCAETCRE